MNPNEPAPLFSPPPPRGSKPRVYQPRCSEPQIRQHLVAWQASGLSLAAYARERGLKPSTLDGWRKREARRTTAANPLAFVEARVMEPRGVREPLTVRLSEGVELIGHEVAVLVDFVHHLRGGRP